MKRIIQFFKSQIKSYRRRREFNAETSKELSRIQREDDPEGAKISTPPDDESIELHSVWVTEIYPPSKINGLKKSLKNLGWDLARETLEENTYTKWVDDSRSGQYGGAWINLGLILPPGKESIIETLNAKLPRGVAYASAAMRTVAPSLTLLTIQFVFDDNTVKSLESTLRQQFTSYIKRYKRRHGKTQRISYIEVPSQKRTALAKQREVIYRSCQKWFHQNLPGIFCDASTTRGMPTAELLTTLKKHPVEQPLRARDTYFDMLLGVGAHEWVSKNNPNINLIFPGGVYRKLTPIFYAQKESVMEGLKGYGGEERNKLTNFIDRSSSGLIGLLAIGELLDAYIAGLSNIRDNAAAKPKGFGRIFRGIRAIKKARGQLLTVQSDARLLSEDFSRPAFKKRGYFLDASDFTATGVFSKLYTTGLVEYLNRGIEDRIDYIKGFSDNVKDTVLIANGLTNDETNLRIQRQLIGLTILTLLIAALTLYVTWHSTLKH